MQYINSSRVEAFRTSTLTTITDEFSSLNSGIDSVVQSSFATSIIESRIDFEFSVLDSTNSTLTDEKVSRISEIRTSVNSLFDASDDLNNDTLQYVEDVDSVATVLSEADSKIGNFFIYRSYRYYFDSYNANDADDIVYESSIKSDLFYSTAGLVSVAAGQSVLLGEAELTPEAWAESYAADYDQLAIWAGYNFPGLANGSAVSLIMEYSTPTATNSTLVSSSTIAAGVTSVVITSQGPDDIIIGSNIDSPYPGQPFLKANNDNTVSTEGPGKVRLYANFPDGYNGSNIQPHKFNVVSVLERYTQS